VDTEEHYTDIEVQDLIKNLGQADYARLLQIFTKFGCENRAKMKNHDVLHTAIMKTVNNDRKWPKNVKPITFLANVGRSIVSNEEEKYSNETLPSDFNDLVEAPDYSIESVHSHIPAKHSHQSVQSDIDSHQNSDEITTWINRIFELFEDDGDATCFLKNRLAELKKLQIMAQCALTEKIYQNTLKRIKDKARKKFPNGVPWWEIKS